MERRNIKTSPSRIMRDVMVQEKVIKEACSAHALRHGTAKAPTGLVCQGHQKAGQKYGLTGKEVKDLNVFIKDMIKEII
eukprot:12399055-Ditylum_brightwellii.AAC.1